MANKDFIIKLQKISDNLLKQNQDLKRTIELRDIEIQTLKDLIKIKQDEIYNLQSIIIGNECQK